MTDFLDALERQLVDAVDERTRRAPTGSRERRGAPSRRRLMQVAVTVAPVAVAALFLATALDGGSRSQSAGRRSVTAAVGLPLRGHSRLSSLTVADPAGGPAWGMRIVHTATNLVCLQIGRLEHGRLAPLEGVMGDGVVHLLPPPAPPPGVIGSGVVEEAPRQASRPHHPSLRGGGCQPPGTVVSYPPGITQAAVASQRADASQARLISFGLLGPDARSVTYRFGGRSRTQAVEPGTGAYLIVLPATGAITAVASG